MSLDPRLGAVRAHRPGGLELDALASLTQRVAALERAATFQTFTGSPTSVVPSGTGGVQTDTPRLWIRVGATWRYTALT